MRKIVIVFLLCVSALCYGQSNELWQEVPFSRTESFEKFSRKTMPSVFETYTIDEILFTNQLAEVPRRSSSVISTTKISLPVLGIFEDFTVFEAPILEDNLAAMYPEIKSYIGKGITDPTSIARFSVSKNGIHAMIMSGKHKTVYVDPFTKEGDYYISYSTGKLPPNPVHFECSVTETLDYKAADDDFIPFVRNADDGLLRTFRLAIAATGEYSQFHLNDQGIPNSATDMEKKEAVLSAMNTTMTRVNGIFERDLGVTMVIVDNNTDIIFLDPNTDNLTNNSPGSLISESQTVCDDFIGNANYDIGHTFSTQGGGLAQLQSPCVPGLKAQGITGINQPIGDFYDIDYVSHEMGHQYGAQHPQNNNCQRSNSSIEPGSASTIMGYAGVCPPNIQNNSDDYFNVLSIQEMWNHVSNGSGTCSNNTATNNEAPEVNAGPNYTIPKSTPFVLRSTATDADGNGLTYCWEQVDAQPAPMPPTGNASSGPLFRSLDPVDVSDRYMPNLSSVISNQNGSTWEVLPNVARNMRFRVTVRDNAVTGGSSASDETIISVTDSGPFQVNIPTNTSIWSLNEQNVVNWDVADSDVSPVNSPNVDILLSIDGGLNFDTVLLANTPNNGEALIETPDGIETTEARIMVRSSNNIFYDINPGEFTITQVLNTEEQNFSEFLMYPNPSSDSITISFNPQNNDVVFIQVLDVNGRILFSTNDKNTTTTFTEVIDIQNLDGGMYFLNIKNGNNLLTRKLIKK